MGRSRANTLGSIDREKQELWPTRGTEEIIRDAEPLPVGEKLKVVDSLLRSLNPPDAEIDRRWIAEAHRRLKEVRFGRVQPVAGTDVIQRLRERFPEAMNLTQRRKDAKKMRIPV